LSTSSKARRAAKTLSGFYVTRNAYQGKHFVALILDKHSRQNVVIVRPTTGRNEMNTAVSLPITHHQSHVFFTLRLQY